MDLIGGLGTAQIDALLHGAFVPVDRGALAPRAAQAATLGVYPTPPPDPKHPSGFFVEWDTQNLGPTLCFRDGGGYSPLVGGPLWDHAWLSGEQEGWQDYGDDAPQAFLHRTVAGDTGLGHALPERTLAAWLERVSREQAFDVIADPVFPRLRDTNGNAWIGRTPEQTYCALLMGNIQYTARMRGAMVLMRHRTAEVHPRPHLLPWAKIRELRETADRHGGYLDLPHLEWLSGLPREQATGLEEEFPVASGGVVFFRQILQFAVRLGEGAREALATPEGLRFADAGLEAREVLLAGAGPKDGSTDFRRADVLVRNFRTVRVSLLQEMREEEHTVRTPEGLKREKVTIPKLVWRVRVPGEEDLESTLVQKPRQPLSPE